MSYKPMSKKTRAAMQYVGEEASIRHLSIKESMYPFWGGKPNAPELLEIGKALAEFEAHFFQYVGTVPYNCRTMLLAPSDEERASGAIAYANWTREQIEVFNHVQRAYAELNQKLLNRTKANTLAEHESKGAK